MMAENSVMPYMPRLEMVNVPPENSSGFSLFAFACAAHAATLAPAFTCCSRAWVPNLCFTVHKPSIQVFLIAVQIQEDFSE